MTPALTHFARSQAPLAKVGAGVAPSLVPGAADLVSLVSFATGLWWAVGGPTWAGIVSIAADELDGRIARATNTTSERGSALDWGIDVALTPLSLLRLGESAGHPNVALLAAVPTLYAQAHLRAEGWRPPFLSARALIMLSAMAFERTLR